MNEEREGLLTTEGGFKYIEVEGGLKLRESKVAYRLIEDEETYDEYRLRRRVMKYLEKKQRALRPYWDSKKLGTLSQERINKALEDEAKKESERIVQ